MNQPTRPAETVSSERLLAELKQRMNAAWANYQARFRRDDWFDWRERQSAYETALSANDKVERRAPSTFAPTTGSADERDRRLMMAEDILSDLASGYWTAILDDNDDPVNEKIGQRILNYWRTWDSPQNAEVREPRHE